MSKSTWEQLQATLSWDDLHDEPLKATAVAPAMPRPVDAPRIDSRIVMLAIFGIVAVLVIVAAGNLASIAPRPADAAPRVEVEALPSTVQIATPTPPPGVILYSSILAATPDSRVHHSYELWCKGEIREYAGLDALRAAIPLVLAEMGKRRGKVYTEADCKCIAPYYEGEGHRECGLH